MILRPLGDRVLIRPEPAPTETESGLQLVEHWKPEQVGTVTAVGRPVHPDRAEAQQLALRLRLPGHAATCHCLRCHAAHVLSRLTAREPLVKAGEVVAFGWNVGQEVWIDQERFFIMSESDLSAVIESTAEGVAS